METRSYSIEGMTCTHCVAAITSEVRLIPGISSVLVDLNSHAMSVTGDAIDDVLVAAAVTEAGYSVISR
jgi:copper chaperone